MNPLLSEAVSLNGTRVRLRGLSKEDLPSTLAWRNDERSRKWFKSQEILQAETHAAWFERYRATESPDCMFFAETYEGVPVGQTSIYNFDPALGTAEVGRFLSDPDLRGKGLFREALLLTLDWAFEELKLRSVHLEVFEHNVRAIKLYESICFRANADADRGMLEMHLSREHFARNRIQVVPRVEGVRSS